MQGCFPSGWTPPVGWGAYAPLFVRKTQQGFLERFIYDAVSVVHFFMERYRLCQREANAFASTLGAPTCPPAGSARPTRMMKPRCASSRRRGRTGGGARRPSEAIRPGGRGTQKRTWPGRKTSFAPCIWTMGAQGWPSAWIILFHPLPRRIRFFGRVVTTSRPASTATASRADEKSLEPISMGDSPQKREGMEGHGAAVAARPASPPQGPLGLRLFCFDCTSNKKQKPSPRKGPGGYKIPVGSPAETGAPPLHRIFSQPPRACM